MNITVVLLYNNRIYNVPADRGEAISFGSGKKDTVYIENFKPAQIEVEINFDTFSVLAKKYYGVEKKNLSMDSFVMLDKASKTLLFASAVTSSKTTRLKVPFSGSISIGRSEENDVVLHFPFVSGHHLTLKSESGIVRVEDNNSSNGLFLNGRRISIARMNSGDVLTVMSIQIKLLNGVLYFYNAGNRIKVKLNNTQENADAKTHASFQKNRLLYRRSPRANEKLPQEDIILANAPTKGQKFEKGRSMFSSLAGSGAMLAGSLATGMVSPALLAARAASIVSPITSIAANKGANKKRKKKSEQYEAMRREKYGAYIQAQKARIESVAKVQRQIIMRANPNIAECADITEGLKRSLWERRPEDSDFLETRIGMGYEPLCVSVKARQDSSFRMEEDEVKELTDRIIEETRIVDNVPSRVSLAKYQSVGIVGSRSKVIGLTKNMLVSLCTSHCYEDVHIIGLFDENEKHIWESVRWLPHIWDENRQSRFLAFDRRNTHAVCEMLSEIIKSRKNSKDQSYLKPQRKLPHYIVLFGSKESVEKENVMQHLFDADSSTGITSLFLFDDLYMLPHHCQYIIDVDNNPCAYESTESNNKFFFTIDKPLDDRSFDRFARRMSAIELEGFSKRAGIPDSVTFLKGFGVEKVDQLHVFDRWAQAQPYNSLAAPIGVMGGEKTFYLDIHEKAFGPHGLVAGTTGSGKSEILQTWILSMALTFHPHDVTFVLIDYKGGGMASLLEPLPHVVGKITNIGSNISRSLISLQSEIKRRQRLFDEAGVNHIDKYQRLYKSGMAKEPLPHLIIVADEFAELKKEEPEFMAGLISASRVGRSLGVHSILATQKPGGIVDDQIQSNSRFRLCLKVQDATDSREMIKRPDAARLTQPGRAYIRVGEDEYFDLFQSYYSGAPYIETDRSDKQEEFEVSFVELNGARNNLIPKPKRSKNSDIDELQAIVNNIVDTAQKHNIPQLSGPWLPELPELLALDKLDQQAQSLSWPKLPIGLYDNPKAQAQGLQTIDFSAEGHHAIYGTSGTGKTTLLKTILLGIGRYYRPDEISAYVIDAGGWSLSAFAGMPNIGGVTLDSEEEKIEKLQTLVLDEFESRKKLFLKNSVSSLKAYREDISSDLPAIIIAVDNIVPLFEMYPDIENFFVSIARDGATYGIYLLYTANSTSGVRYKIVQNIRGAIAFELTDKGDYPTIVGRPEETLAKITGRAFFKGNPPTVFQAAIPFRCSGDREANDYIQRESAQKNAGWNGPRPKAIPVMPEILTWDMLNNIVNDRRMLPAGMAYDTIEPLAFDLSCDYSLLVTGPPHSGKSDMLIKMMSYFSRSTSDTSFVILDSKAGRLSQSDVTTSYYAVSNDHEKITEIMNDLVAQLNTRKKQQNAAKKENPDLDEKQFALGFEQIAIFVDDIKEFVDEVSDENRNTMERICRMAEGLGVIVVCAGRSSDVAHYNEIESLTRVIVANQNGLVLSGTPAQYPFFRSNLKYSEKEIEAGEGNGYAFVGGSCRKLKLPV